MAAPYEGLPEESGGMVRQAGDPNMEHSDCILSEDETDFGKDKPVHFIEMRLARLTKSFWFVFPPGPGGEEKDTVQALVLGQTAAEMADAMGLSPAERDSIHDLASLHTFFDRALSPKLAGANGADKHGVLVMCHCPTDIVVGAAVLSQPATSEHLHLRLPASVLPRAPEADQTGG